jgi:hypothetical protein
MKTTDLITSFFFSKIKKIKKLHKVFKYTNGGSLFIGSRLQRVNLGVCRIIFVFSILQYSNSNEHPQTYFYFIDNTFVRTIKTIEKPRP